MQTQTTQAATRMAYVPGSVQFSYRAQERRTERYRTWRGNPDMGWCWECLLCGEWRSSFTSRADAERHAGDSHPSWCHVATGCHCPMPHLTAAMGARLGIDGQYPYWSASVLFRLAGGVRKQLPRPTDRFGTAYACWHCDQREAGAS